MKQYYILPTSVLLKILWRRKCVDLGVEEIKVKFDIDLDMVERSCLSALTHTFWRNKEVIGKY